MPETLDLNMRPGDHQGDMAGASVFRVVLDSQPSSGKQVLEKHKRTELFYTVRVKVRRRAYLSSGQPNACVWYQEQRYWKP